MDGGDIGLSGGALSMVDAADVGVAFFLFLVFVVLPIPCFFLLGGIGGMLKNSQVQINSKVSNESKRHLVGG